MSKDTADTQGRVVVDGGGNSNRKDVVGWLTFVGQKVREVFKALCEHPGLVTYPLCWILVANKHCNIPLTITINDA